MKMTPKTIIIGGLAVVLSVVAVVVFLPVAVFKPAPTLTTQPYTALEKEGLELYKSNGCVYCHSQYTRPNDHSTSPASRAGEYVYDNPHQLGTLRTGPDLGNIGYKRGDRWEADHLRDPRQFTPNSIMPAFSFLTDRQLTALVAYLNRLGTKRNATTDLMVPGEYNNLVQPFPIDIDTWNAGRRVYLEHCLTCHGCAGTGNGPYANMNNARPADLRQPRFKNLDPSFFFWRINEGVAGTVMPQWEQSLTEKQRWQVVAFIQGAFIDMVPHFTDEGEMPAAYSNAKPPTDSSEEYVATGKAIWATNCSFCHGYGGAGDGPNARGLQPAPPSFLETATYAEWTPQDYYWRVSESIPMRAMPQWRYWFDSDQRWAISEFVQRILLFPDPNAEPGDPEIPKSVEGLKVPTGTSVMRGREVYLNRCWMCHGDAGQGDGPSAQNLVPAPADFTVDEFDTMPDHELFWKINVGINNTAMPQWGLLLSEQERWEAIEYVKRTFISPSEPDDVSDETPVQYQALESPWENTEQARANGGELYQSLCAGCHGPKALGDGKYGPPLMPTPANLAEDPALTSPAEWWYWRIDQGVVGFDGGDEKNLHPTAMPAWRFILTDEQKWDIVFYARDLAGAKDPQGGN